MSMADIAYELGAAALRPCLDRLSREEQQSAVSSNLAALLNIQGVLLQGLPRRLFFIWSALPNPTAVLNHQLVLPSCKRMTSQ